MEFGYFLAFLLLFILYLWGGKDTDYTTEGVAVALIVAVLRAQVRRVEVQVVTVGRTADSRLPVAAAATSVAQITITIVVVASAEEGERFRQGN